MTSCNGRSEAGPSLRIVTTVVTAGPPGTSWTVAGSALTTTAGTAALGTSALSTRSNPEPVHRKRLNTMRRTVSVCIMPSSTSPSGRTRREYTMVRPPVGTGPSRVGAGPE